MPFAGMMFRLVTYMYFISLPSKGGIFIHWKSFDFVLMTHELL